MKGSKRPTVAPAAAAVAGPFGERGPFGEGGGPFGDLPPPPGSPNPGCRGAQPGLQRRASTGAQPGLQRRASTGAQPGLQRRASTGGVPSNPLLLAGVLGSTPPGRHQVFDFAECRPGSPGTRVARTASHGSVGQARAASSAVAAPRDAPPAAGISIRRMSLPELGEQPPIRGCFSAAAVGGGGAGGAAGSGLTLATPSLGQLPAARPGAARRTSALAAAAAPQDAPPGPRPAASDDLPAAAVAPAAEQPPEPARQLTERRRSSEPAVPIIERSQTDEHSPGGRLWLKASKVVVEEVRAASKARREDAAEALQEALAGKDQSQIIEAIGQAKAVGVDKKTVSEATKALHRLIATDALEEAKSSRNAEKLRQALSRAKAAGLTSKQLEEYDECLKQLDAETLLVVSTMRAESGALKIAIGAARSRGIESGEALEAAEKKLQELEAIRALQAAVKSGQAHRIREAIERLPDSCSEAAEEARRMLAGLEPNGPDEGDGSRSTSPKGKSVTRSRSLNRNLTAGLDLDRQRDAEPVDEVEERLRRAMSFKETGALKLALQAAKAYGSRYAATIDEAERMLAQVESVWQLNAAVKKGDVAKLKEVMERAVAAGVEEQVLGQARLLVEQADARTALSNAIKSKEPAELEAALAAARSCGVDRARIVRAEQALMQVNGGSSKEPVQQAAVAASRR